MVSYGKQSGTKVTSQRHEYGIRYCIRLSFQVDLPAVIRMLCVGNTLSIANTFRGSCHGQRRCVTLLDSRSYTVRP